MTSGVSGTTLSRLSLSTLFNFPSLVSALLPATAVHGTLDRSGIRFFTQVPQVYRDLGFTEDQWDYRGILDAVLPPKVPVAEPALLDWDHDAGFPKPYTPHPVIGLQKRWHDHTLTYFAQWKTDEIRAEWTGAEPQSRCLDNSVMFANPREFEFFGAGLPDRDGVASIRVIPATRIFSAPPGGFTPAGVIVAPGKPSEGTLEAAAP